MTLSQAAVAVLETANAAAKGRGAQGMAEAWRTGEIREIGRARPPSRPARPTRPDLRRPGDMPRRWRGRGPKGRIALLHAIAHIELNAIDLACDIVARFAEDDLPRAFFGDWTIVAGEEALHFTLVCERLGAMGAAYGDLPAHDGLWEAAEATADDVLARLAVVPLVLEARGLDVTPPMITRLDEAGDGDSARVLGRIYEDEIGHVAHGRRWFDYVCARRGLDPTTAYHAAVRVHFKGTLKPPFNESARARAGLGTAFYAPLAGDPAPSATFKPR